MADDWPWPTWEQWLEQVDADTRARAESLRDRFRRLGATEPESWARSEVSEDIAQLGRFVFLNTLWRQIEEWRNPEAVTALLPDATREVLEAARTVAGRVAFDVVLNVVQVLDDEEDVDASEPAPGWRLMELDPDGELTGRDLGALHESFLDVDPRHIDGADVRGW